MTPYYQDDMVTIYVAPDLRIAVMRALEQTADPHSPWTTFADKVVAEYGGTMTECPLEGVHEHAFRGPHRFHEWEPGT